MTTVTAKKLRDNLSQYLDKLEGGEEVVIIRNSEIIGSLQPVSPGSAPNGQAVAAMLDRNNDYFKSNRGMSPDNLSAKELYHKALDDKYGL